MYISDLKKVKEVLQKTLSDDSLINKILSELVDKED